MHANATRNQTEINQQKFIKTIEKIEQTQERYKTQICKYVIKIEN